MYGEWEGIQFSFVEYKETGVSILSAVEDIQVSTYSKFMELKTGVYPLKQYCY